jgi:hypothetical protein
LYRAGAQARLLVQKHQRTTVTTVSRLTITLSEARELVSRARARAALTETAALEVARQNVKSVRRKP